MDQPAPHPRADTAPEPDASRPTPPLTLRVAAFRVGIVAAIFATLLGAGAANGVGPLAHQTPPADVTDPGEQLARSLQAVIDASSVHLEATLAGTVPGALVGRADPSVTLDGTHATLDLRPQDARTHLVFESLPVGRSVEAITSWDTMAYRVDGGAWEKGSLASVVAGTGIDANPLTLVDRVRAWLREPGAPTPTSTDVSCGAPSGVCRDVSVALGPDAGTAVIAALPSGRTAAIGPTTTEVVLLTEAATLRPARLTLTTRTADRSIDVTLVADFTLWDWPSVIPDPPGG